MIALFTLLSLSIAYILLVWFKTNAFYEYAQLMCKDWIVLTNYEKVKHDYPEFSSFIAIEYSGFFIRLVTCPICLSFWLALLPAFSLSVIILSTLFSFSLLLSILFFILWPVVTLALACFSLLLYLVLARIA